MTHKMNKVRCCKMYFRNHVYSSYVEILNSARNRLQNRQYNSSSLLSVFHFAQYDLKGHFFVKKYY